MSLAEIDNALVGDLQASRIYIGDNLVWSVADEDGPELPTFRTVASTDTIEAEPGDRMSIVDDVYHPDPEGAKAFVQVTGLQEGVVYQGGESQQSAAMAVVRANDETTLSLEDAPVGALLPLTHLYMDPAHLEDFSANIAMYAGLGIDVEQITGPGILFNADSPPFVITESPGD